MFFLKFSFLILAFFTTRTAHAEESCETLKTLISNEFKLENCEKLEFSWHLAIKKQRGNSSEIIVTYFYNDSISSALKKDELNYFQYQENGSPRYNERLAIGSDQKTLPIIEKKIGAWKGIQGGLRNNTKKGSYTCPISLLQNGKRVLEIFSCFSGMENLHDSIILKIIKIQWPQVSP
jgi:hypothetical protein